jgi:hypothetical protein
MVISNSPKKESYSRKKNKNPYFSPSIYGQFEIGKKITGIFQRGFQVAVHALYALIIQDFPNSQLFA